MWSHVTYMVSCYVCGVCALFLQNNYNNTEVVVE
jgi:hypothetical protein